MIHPVIHVPNQLVGAPLGTDVTLECNVEAYPKSINYWVRDTGEYLQYIRNRPVISRAPVETIRVMERDALRINGLGSELSIAFINHVQEEPVRRSKVEFDYQRGHSSSGQDQDPSTLLVVLSLSRGHQDFNEPDVKCLRSEMVISSAKYDVDMVSKSLFHVKMTAIVRNLQKEDAGSYRCIAKNSLGEVESNIRLYDIPGPTRPYGLSLDEEDYNEQFGSAERDQDEEISNSVVER
ncbi:hypothetical protein NQ317_012479 [Molorchus minor]|uniref:Ig-like domain-containing protein n=1 Tax=Molorchus minor TaxID=1323400 RepID=A0ABQ9K2V9_9CUCU|nr:hypothetical protein NQ317_012479 [Molorchus minor]